MSGLVKTEDPDIHDDIEARQLDKDMEDWSATAQRDESLEATKKDLSDLSDIIERVNQRVITTHNDHREDKAKLIETEEQFGRAITRVAQLEKELAEKAGTMNNLQEETKAQAEKTKAALIQANRKNEANQRYIGTLKRQLKRATTNMSKASEDKKAADNRIEEMSATVASLKKQAVVLKNQVRRANQRITADNKTYRDSIEALNAQLLSANADLEKVSKEKLSADDRTRDVCKANRLLKQREAALERQLTEAKSSQSILTHAVKSEPIGTYDYVGSDSEPRTPDSGNPNNDECSAWVSSVQPLTTPNAVTDRDGARATEGPSPR